MPNRLRLTGILNPPADDAFRPGVGYVRFEPADDRAATWAVPGYRPAWPILGVPNAVGGALQEINGGDVFVPGDEPGDAHAGPWMRVSYELQTTAGTWHRGTYLWRAVSTGGGVIDIRTPAPEQEPPIVSRPGVPAGALLTTDVGNLVPSKAEVDGALVLLPDPGLPTLQRTNGDNYFAAQKVQREGESIRTRTHVTQTISFECYTAAQGYTSDTFVAFAIVPPAGWFVTCLHGATSTTSATDGIPRSASMSGRDQVVVGTKYNPQKVRVSFTMRPA